MRLGFLLTATLGFAGLSLPSIAEVKLDLNHFETRLMDEGVAAVRTQRDYPASVLNQACRRTLSQPLRAEVQQRLSSQLDRTIPDDVSFIVADIENYRSWEKDGWLQCSAEVAISDWPRNLAGLAVRAAWHQAEAGERGELRPLLAVALESSHATADAVALIASLAPEQQRAQYLDANLQPTQLTMHRAMLVVGQIWFDSARWNDVLELTKRCDSVSCRRLGIEAQEQKEIEDAEKADDLSSYL